MTTNDIRKGTKVMLRNGWGATVEDNNTRGTTRLCTVYGWMTEMGSVYSSDIVKAEVNGVWTDVQMTSAQAKARANRNLMGF